MLSLRHLSSTLPSSQVRTHRVPAIIARLLTTETTTPSPFCTQPKAVYTLPYYGASDQALHQLPDPLVKKALRAYGGLIRSRDQPQQLRERLRYLTNATYRPKQLTIHGVVVSNKMDKSVVIAAKRQCYSTKLQKDFTKTRRFMAHDELNLCREGDRVVIRSCRILSKRKSHVVVENYGDPARPEQDLRAVNLDHIHT